MELLTAEEYAAARLEWSRLVSDGVDPVSAIAPERLVAFWTTHGINDLYFFAKFILGYDKLSSRLHLDMCRFAEQTHPRKGFIIPRGHYKSSLITIAKTIWDLIRNPEERILIVHERGDQARQFLAQIRSHFESNRLLNQLYPERIPPWKSKGWRWTADAINIRRPREWPEPSVFAAGWSAAFQGMHFTTLRFDDLIGEEAAANPEIMEKVVDWVRRSNPLFVNPKDGVLDMIGTRWSYRDVYSWAMETYDEMKWFVRSAIIQVRHPETGELMDAPLFPEEFTMELLQKLQREMGIFSFSCLPASAPITMADWTERPISSLRPGDRVIGYDIHTPRIPLVEAEVTEVGCRLDSPLYRFHLEDGSSIECTDDHQWFDVRHRSRGPYKPLSINTYHGLHQLSRVYTSPPPLPPTLSRDAGWLAGMFDGEGSCFGGSGDAIFFHQSASHNPGVCDELRRCFDRLGFKYGESHIHTTSEKNGKPGEAVFFYLKGGRSERIRFLRWCQPLKSEKVLSTLMGTKPIKETVGVISAEYLGRHPTYWIATTSGNYIAYGFASKNSQYQNQPTTGTTQEFRDSWLRFYTKGESIIEGRRTAVVQQRPTDIRSSSETERVPLPALSIYIHVDPGIGLVEGRAKAEAKHSHSAIAVVGIAHPRRIFLLHAWKRVVSVPELQDQILRFFTAYEPYISRISIESHSWTQMVRPGLLGMAADRGIALTDGRVEAYTKSANTRKEGRIRKLQPYFSNGQIFIEEDMLEFRREYLDFPQAPPWDLLDAMAQGPEYWVFPDTGETDPELEDAFAIDTTPDSYYDLGRSRITGY
jgi:hypothetical protein